MEIQNVEVSNMANVGKKPKLDPELGAFLEILNPLLEETNIDLDLEDLLMESLDLDLETDEEDKEGIDQSIAMMLHMPWTRVNETEIEIPKEMENGGLLEIEDSMGEELLANKEVGLFQTETLETSQTEDVINTEDIESTKIFSNLLEEVDQDLSKDIEDLPKENSIKVNEEKALFTKSSEENIKVEEDMDRFDIEDTIIKGLSDENRFEVKETKTKENESTNLSPVEIQNNTMEPILETQVADFQDSSLISENIERVSESIIKLMEVESQGDTKVMKVKLHPEELGHVDIILKMEEGKLIANILVDNDGARQLFNNNIQELSQNLIKQNIHIGDMNVDLNNNSQGNSQNQNQKLFRPSRNINVNNGFVSKESINEPVVASRGVSILA